MNNVLLINRFSGTRTEKLVYCPMCDLMHINNTQCQRNDMRSDKFLRNFAYSCIRNYSTFDGDQYDLQVSDLPDFVQHEFAALIGEYDSCYAAEACSSDNKLWGSNMLPSLLRFLQNSTNQDLSIEFKNTWRDCVTSYMHNFMQELIDGQIDEYNNDQGCFLSHEKANGVDSHARI